MQNDDEEMRAYNRERPVVESCDLEQFAHWLFIDLTSHPESLQVTSNCTYTRNNKPSDQ